MNKEAQRIAILTHLGWSDLTREGRRGEDGPLQALRGTSPDGREDMVAPNPVTSLDSMHEAEKALDSATEWQGEEHHACAEEAYMGHLADITSRTDDWALIHATAAQRAEAFLRAIGKWQGGEGGAQ